MRDVLIYGYSSKSSGIILIFYQFRKSSVVFDEGERRKTQKSYLVERERIGKLKVRTGGINMFKKYMKHSKN